MRRLLFLLSSLRCTPYAWVCRKEEKRSAVESIITSKLYNDDPVRYMALSYVKSHVVERFLPFSLYDEGGTAEWLEVLVNNDPEQKGALVPRLGSKQVLVDLLVV